MLEIKNITKRFGGVRALNKCSFAVPEGKITALVGPNGAGKTTLFDVISGLVKPDEGEVILGERESLVGLQPHEIAQRGVARTWQQVRLFTYLTILDHLQLAESGEDTKHSYAQVLEQFGIDKPLDTVVTELSYGQRKLLQLAMVYVRPHQLLLLDEPVAGVNAVVQQRIEALLMNWKKSTNTIVIVEHDIEFVRRLADYVVVMDQGRVLAEGEPEVALQDARVAEAYLGA